jgi:hypothetical protein
MIRRPWLDPESKRKTNRNKELLLDKPWGYFVSVKKCLKDILDLSISFLFRGAVKWAILLDKASMVRPRIQKKDQQEQRMIIRQTLGFLCIGKKGF